MKAKLIRSTVDDNMYELISDGFNGRILLGAVVHDGFFDNDDLLGVNDDEYYVEITRGK